MSDQPIPPPRYTLWQAIAVAIGLSQRAVEEVRALAGKPGPAGPPGPAGRLPAVAEWRAGVHYAGGIVTADGATWQAVRDTAAEPPHEDWVCLAARGAAPAFRGAWKAAKTYEALDVVMVDGSSFVALSDAPGACPGDHWRLMASRGKSGPPGPPGAQGERGWPGVPGPAPAALELDGEGVLTLRLADGTALTCDFYPLLARR